MIFFIKILVIYKTLFIVLVYYWVVGNVEILFKIYGIEGFFLVGKIFI